MSFEYTILADGEPAPDLVELATSVIVEQSLDDSARYTIHLEVDLQSDGQYTLLTDDRLRPGAEISILVRDGQTTVCLVQGPVDRAKVHIARGGAGSWLEVMGGDRRVVMDRVHNTAVWSDHDSDSVRSLLAKYELTADVTDTEHSASEKSHTQNQSDTDLAWIQRLARRNGYHFWISYTVDLDPIAGTTVEELAHFKPSPPRPGNSPLAGPALDLAADLADLAPVPGCCPLRLDLNLPDQDTEAMASIDIEVDAERPTQLHGLRVAQADATVDRTSVEDAQHVALGDVPLKKFAAGARSIFLTTAGDAAELQTRARAALAEAEWFVRATLKCTQHALSGRVLQPHMLVPIAGLGARYSGDYFVTAVTHTLDASAHTMDVELARNALGA